MIRLVFIIFFFLTSLLSIFPAPAYPFWLLAILVTEYPWVFVLIIIILLMSGFWMKAYQLPVSILGIMALILVLSPIMRAYAIAGNLQKNLETAFGKHLSENMQPFKISKLFKGSKLTAYQTISYKKAVGTAFFLDFYPSQIAGKKPCVIVVHGGSWSSGDSRQLPELNSYLAGIGYHVAAVNYRLAPKYRNPSPVEDIRDALSFLRSKTTEWHIDSNNFVLLGRSAGAQIALLAAYTLHDPGIKGVIDFYGPADMIWGYSIPSNPLIMNSRRVMEDYLGGTYGQYPVFYENSSPIRFVNRQSPPTLLIHGRNDVLVAYEHSRRLNTKLQENGVKHYLLTLPWATHGFDYNLNGPGGQLSTYAVTHFLKSVTN